MMDFFVASSRRVRGLLMNRMRWRGWLALIAGLLAGPWLPARAGDVVDFNRDIRPILSESCYQCHGPDAGKRKADLRLDTKAGLFREAKGVRNLVPRKPEESEVYARINADDDEIRMPPPRAGKPLAPEKIG